MSHKLKYRNPRATASDMTESSLTEAASLGVHVTTILGTLPTGPHVSKLWDIVYKGFQFYWTTPDNVFQENNVRDYYRHLLEYQRANQYIVPFDLSEKKYFKMVNKLKSVLEKSSVLIPDSQVLRFKSILLNLSKDINVSPAEIQISISDDADLSISKRTDSGTHFLLVGSEDGDLSYVYISNYPGFYDSIHLDEKNSRDNIINVFIAA